MSQQTEKKYHSITINKTIIKEQAYSIAGEAGVACLRSAPLDRIMQDFFAVLILNYLHRELGDLDWKIKTQDNFFTLTWPVKGVRKEWLQLRFAPNCNRWLLMRRGNLKVKPDLNGHTWFPHQPDRPCLSLSDWLGQIRKLMTNRFNENNYSKLP